MRPEPIQPTAADPTPSPDPLFATEVFWSKYQKHIILGVLALLLAVFAIGAYRFYAQRRESAAAALLTTAKSHAEYEKVIAEHPNSAAADSARLLLANVQRTKRQFAEANSTLQAFISANPKHSLVSTAKMAVAANTESLGKPDEALEMYRKIAADYPRSFNAPLALLAQVPLLKQKGQIEDARRVCETVLTQYRESYASSEATAYLRTLKPPAGAPAPQTGATPVAPAPAADASSGAGQAPPTTAPSP